jgi:hypothetical protein
MYLMLVFFLPLVCVLSLHLRLTASDYPIWYLQTCLRVIIGYLFPNKSNYLLIRTNNYSRASYMLTSNCENKRFIRIRDDEEPLKVDS